ncbi:MULTISPECIES: NAD(P)H-binding protein [unclassified Streptomyces]|uniref:NAD(P)H-binding protein n=1 Tax=unclassified Streptomyces TaxID=2593676 RepID=UPI002F919DAC
MSAQNVVLVTGATGNIGPHIVSQLLESGARVRALLLADDPAADRLPAGAEVVYGDLFDPGSLDAALEGVGSVMLMWPFFTLNVDTAPTVVKMIAEQARRVVFVSSIGVHLGLERRDNNCHAYLEELIEETGVEWTFLRTSGFAINAVLSWRQQILADGVVRSPYGAAARSPIDEADLAAVAVRALTTDGHVGEKYVVTGPEAITQAEQLAIIGEAVGRPLRWEDVPHQNAREAMVNAGWPPAYADGALDYFAMLVVEPELVTTTVEDITGRTPRTFRDWAAENAARFR